MLFDVLVNFAEQYAGLQQVLGDLLVDEVAGDHGSNWRFAGGSGGFIDDAKLGAELGRRAERIDGAKHLFPETPTDRQQRVVGHQVLAVFGTGADVGFAQVAGDFAVASVQSLPDDLGTVGLLEQDHFAGDGLHVGIGKVDTDRKTAGNLLQERHVGQRALAGADQQNAAVEVLAEGLGDFVDLAAPLGAIADVLLDFVENEQGTGQLAIRAGQYVADDGQHLVVGDVGRLAELPLDEPFDLVCRWGEVGIGNQQAIGQVRRDVQVAQLLLKLLALGFNVGADCIVEAVLLEPNHESGRGILSRKADGGKDD